MTSERLNELIDLRAEIEDLNRDIKELESYGAYTYVQIIGRCQGESLQSADCLCDIHRHKDLMELILNYLKTRRDELVKKWEEA
ncbi:MAG: hypothetical protein IKU36_02100 [Bacteroidales bacterium]|nr:hypothetical protein [Bacteroidales bacterium]